MNSVSPTLHLWQAGFDALSGRFLHIILASLFISKCPILFGTRTPSYAILRRRLFRQDTPYGGRNITKQEDTIRSVMNEIAKSQAQILDTLVDIENPNAWIKWLCV